MRYRPFGKTGLYVSELFLGTMTFGGKGFWQAIGKMTRSEVETFIAMWFMMLVIPKGYEKAVPGFSEMQGRKGAVHGQ